MIFIAPLIAIAAFVALRRPFYGILLTFAASQADFLVELPAGLSVGRIIAAAATVGWLIEMGREGGGAARVARLWLPKVLAPFVLVCVMGVLLHSRTRESFLALSSVILLALLAVMIEDLVTDQRKVDLLVATVALSYAALAVLPVAAYLHLNIPGVEAARFIGDQRTIMRYQGVTNNPNELGLLLNTAIAMFLAMLLKSRKLVWSVPIIAAIGVCAMGIVLSVSRTHVVGLVVLIGLIGVMRLWGPRKGLARLATLALLCLIPGIYVIRSTPEYAVKRLTLLGEGKSKTTIDRFEFIRLQRRQALEMMMEDPVFGIGLRGFVRYAQNNPLQLGAHDMVSAVVGETGILGICTLSAMLWVVARRLFLVTRATARAQNLELYSLSLVLLASLGSLFFTSLGGTVLFYQRQYWLVVGLSAVLGRWAGVEQSPRHASPGSPVRGWARRGPDGRTP